MRVSIWCNICLRAVYSEHGVYILVCSTMQYVCMVGYKLLSPCQCTAIMLLYIHKVAKGIMHPTVVFSKSYFYEGDYVSFFFFF